jgi:sulfite exporter TauE/SafE
MELIWTAFLLGLVGSLHCAVMCGPLVLAVGNVPCARHPFATSRFVYNLGRLATYCLIGLLFGAVGKTFILAGVQRWLSLAAGAAILIGLLLSTRFALRTPSAKLVLNLKSLFNRVLQRRTLASQFLLGAFNGLLPCGLVYVAAAGAATTLSPIGGALHMAVFGVGTLPMMLGLGIASNRLRFISLRFQKMVPICVTLVAMLLLLRGMALGIPYLSPDLSLTQLRNEACH